MPHFNEHILETVEVTNMRKRNLYEELSGRVSSILEAMKQRFCSHQLFKWRGWKITIFPTDRQEREA